MEPVSAPGPTKGMLNICILAHSGECNTCYFVRDSSV